MLVSSSHRSVSRRRRSIVGPALAILLGLATAGAATAGEADPEEVRLRAAFLYNFAKFVEWPPNRLQVGNEFTFCILGSPALERTMRELMRGRSVNGRPVAVRRAGDDAGWRHCRMAVFGAGASAEMEAPLRAAGDSPILLVGESHDFLDAGGAIAFEREDDRLRFEIDVDNARRRRLRVRSGLLALARSVRGDAAARAAAGPARSR